MVRAKMQCGSIDKRLSYTGAKDTIDVVRLNPVTGDANKPWSQHTPQGSVELHITNPAAVGQFKVGETYYVDFTPAEAPDAT